MDDCCDPIPYRRFFNRKEAERNARTYRKRGLGPMAADLVDYLIEDGVEGDRILEVGGGVGAVQLELLKAGAHSSVNVELSSGYDEAASALAAEEGVENRISRQIGDFVEHQDRFDQADVVIMNRVVCCYPWADRLMEAAVSKTSGRLALVFPREKWWVKTGVGLGNAYTTLRQCGFNAFVHPVSEIESAATGAGLVPRYASNDFIWQSVVFSRSN